MSVMTWGVRYSFFQGGQIMIRAVKISVQINVLQLSTNSLMHLASFTNRIPCH